MRAWLLPVLAIMAGAVSGCALTVDNIDVPYQPLAARPPTPGASSVTIAVKATDERTTHRDRVSSKKNGYGMEMAAIVATNNVVQTLQAGIAQELASDGFAVKEGGYELGLAVVTFYNDFKTGFFSGEAVAEVAFNAKLLRPDKSVVYTKYISGQGQVANIQLATGDNARTALVAAMSSAVGNLFADGEFRTALLIPGTVPPVAGRPPEPVVAVPPPAAPPARVVGSDAPAAAPAEPILVGDGSCLYKPPFAGQALQRIENGQTYTALPANRFAIPPVWRCSNGKLIHVPQ